MWVPWFRLWPGRPENQHGERLSGPSVVLRVACPHCANTDTDTLSLHCPDDRCGWVRCTCGALIYSSRRHRHPRHRSGADTCHDPKAAV